MQSMPTGLRQQNGRRPPAKNQILEPKCLPLPEREAVEGNEKKIKSETRPKAAGKKFNMKHQTLLVPVHQPLRAQEPHKVVEGNGRTPQFIFTPSIFTTLPFR
jgi:hypothetical protein